MDNPLRAERKPSFEERLRAARQKAGLDRSAEVREGTPSPLGAGLRVGLEVASAVVVGVGIGLALDWAFSTRPLFLVVFLFLGGAAGVLNAYRLLLSRR